MPKSSHVPWHIIIKRYFQCLCHLSDNQQLARARESLVPSYLLLCSILGVIKREFTRIGITAKSISSGLFAIQERFFGGLKSINGKLSLICKLKFVVVLCYVPHKSYTTISICIQIQIVCHSYLIRFVYMDFRQQPKSFESD